MAPNDELDELIGAYVLDALESEERRAVESAMDADPLLRVEVGRLQAAFDEVLDSQPVADGPADDLWARISAQLTDRGPIELVDDLGDVGRRPPVVHPMPERRDDRLPTRTAASVPLRSRRTRALVLALAAAIVVVLGIGAVVLAGRSGDVRRGAELALADPSSLDGTLRPSDGAPGAAIRVVVDRDGVAYALPTAVPPPPPGHEYQLWSIDGATPESLGLMGSLGADESMPLPHPAVKLAVTVEPTGGSPQPTGAPVLVGDLA